MDWGSFEQGMAAGLLAEALVGAFVTAPLAVWYFKRQIPHMLDTILTDDVRFKELRSRIFNGLMGNMGGRPMSVKKIAKNALAMTVQEIAPAVARRAVGWLHRNKLMEGPAGQNTAGRPAPIDTEVFMGEDGHKYVRVADTAQ